ncbi:MAG: ubiquinone/menaquinone biosynthesis methyltransferase [Desulfovibrionaceae bacterium]|nr:ubiquinone/menaquinone biosynthesis methyltransferase [Desulfovibrionaceae bacterium]MBR5734960.1 ubiquinone/menaquinone biosynthesis methyltransferase [Desulfovibrionaceae bacterium]
MPAETQKTEQKQPQPGEKAVAAMFGRIVRWYDPLNRLLSLGLDQGWRAVLAQTALAGFENTADLRALDLAAGTLDVSLALHARRPDAHITAMDFCQPMLERGRAKLKTPALQAAISTATADARALPLPDASFHTVTMAFGIRNIAPRIKAMREMHRVLMPGGRACILEFGSGRQRIWKGVYNFYLDSILPLMGKFFSGDSAYAYLARTIREFPTADELADELLEAGFGSVYHLPLTSGIVRLHVAEKRAE